METIRELNLENFDVFFKDSFVRESFRYSNDLNLEVVINKAKSFGLDICQQNENSKLPYSDQYENVCIIMGKSNNIEIEDVPVVSINRDISNTKSNDILDLVKFNTENMMSNRSIENIVLELQSYISILSSLSKLENVNRDLINVFIKIAAISVKSSQDLSVMEE